MHTFDPTTRGAWGWGAGAGGSLSLRACLIYSVPGQSGFVRETLLEKKKSIFSSFKPIKL